MGRVTCLVIQCVKCTSNSVCYRIQVPCLMLLVGATNRSLRTTTARRNTSLVQPCVIEVYLMLRDV